jgi:hypothetical protein
MLQLVHTASSFVSNTMLQLVHLQLSNTMLQLVHLLVILCYS